MLATVITADDLWDCDPFRPLSRRAIDASNLVAGQPREWSSDGDPQVAKYAEYLRRARGSKEGGEPPGAESAVISAAHELAGRQDPVRWEIEGRLLAGQTDEEIATVCKLPSDVISWFEAPRCDADRAGRAEPQPARPTPG